MMKGMSEYRNVLLQKMESMQKLQSKEYQYQTKAWDTCIVATHSGKQTHSEGQCR